MLNSDTYRSPLRITLEIVLRNADDVLVVQAAVISQIRSAV
ncbi:MAG: hypothetical protein R3C53_20000 [Pirellulaceae bacterium]